MKTEPGTLSPVPDELTLDEIMNRVRSELRHRRQELLASAIHGGGLATDDDVSLRWEAPSTRLELKQAYTLAELLQFSDADFIEMAYRVLLRRPADVEGLNGRLTALRNGSISKVGILGDIRFSEEGMQRAVHVDGLLLPYKFSRWRRIPVLGQCMTLALSILRLPRVGKSLQAVEAVAARETQRLGALLNRLEKSNEDRFSRLEAMLDKVISDEDQQAQRIEAMRIELQSEHEELCRQQQAIEGLSSQLSSLRELSDACYAEIGRLADARYAEIRKFSDARYAELGKSFDARHTELATAANDNRRGILDIQRRLMTFLDVAQVMPVGVSMPPSVDIGLGDILSAQYVSFEDTFRGTREDIKQRAEHYLKVLDLSDIKQTNGLVLDLGCGRGEWLEVLGEHGYLSQGVDLNRVMVEEARDRGFDVVEADALLHLRSLPDGSVAVITSMHLVEHLPYETLIRLLDESMRVLRPGGLLLLETPNPENLTVGACWFYMDPSHRNPIPPALLQWLVSDRGFAQAEIQRLSENRGLQRMELLSDDVPGAKQINELIGLITAPPDYAVVAVRP